MERIAFATLGRVEFRDRTVLIWQRDSTLLAAIGLSDPAARDRLRRVLMTEGVDV